ncbi:vitronectin b [Takifugu rubripes]|uniref:Vitronectin b n=1 Tax=Takifugu rubripes TaxID=31033 RepID=H2U3R0_TAKRU|nr:vitronectin-like [Takifugu rubripes]|eukprot:XP_003971087.1 PREDICTED: vitronectin-like [Takifugu rubripes]
MKLGVVLLSLVLLLDKVFAAEESCVGRCGSFNPRSKCQCDSMCTYYESCCVDFYTICPKKISRGDTFSETEEVTEAATTPPETTAAPTVGTLAATTPTPLTPNTPDPTFLPVDAHAAPCSGRPFDAFLQLKNTSIYAFRGEYFFELDEKSILPGYPKLIQDVWGIPGPIDAAFTRINCHGKSYIFKGSQYWRFDGDVMDEDYPRNISVGFGDVPDGVDAAFAVPAPSHRGKEKAYFFKEDRYYQYEFKHQPSHEECVEMNKASPSILFRRYNDLFCDQTWEDLFTELFGGPVSSHHLGPRQTSQDWGIRPPVDAAMVGKVFLGPKPTSPPPARRRSNRRRKPSRRRTQRRRQSRFVYLYDLWDYDYWFGDYSTEGTTKQKHQSTPVQNVYFFMKDKYYRVDLQTKRVDSAIPPYPRSIAKYWLGCEAEEPFDAPRAEKKHSF